MVDNKVNEKNILSSNSRPNAQRKNFSQPIQSPKNLNNQSNHSVASGINSKNSLNSMQQQNVIKNVPGMVKFLSVLDWIIAILLIILGIFITVFFGFISGAANQSAETASTVAGGFVGTLLKFAIFGGLIIFALGVFIIFVAIGLWKGRKWAWVSQIVLSSLSIISIIWNWIQLGFGSGKTVFVINVAIVSYLSISKSVREAFLQT